MIAPVTLAPCTDPGRLAHLRQRPGQYASDGPVIAADPTPGLTLHEIRQGDLVAGCFKLDPLYHQRHDFADPQTVGLRGVLIDRELQGRGIGSAAMAQLGPYIAAACPDARRAVLTVNVKNPGARAVYLRAGWRDDGGIYHGGSRGPQHILWLDLPQQKG